ITVNSDKVVIEDTVINEHVKETDVKLQWLTSLNAELKNESRISIDNGNWDLNLISNMQHDTKIYYGSDESEFRGWISSTYGEKHPANQIVYNVKSKSNEIKIKTILTKV